MVLERERERERERKRTFQKENGHKERDRKREEIKMVLSKLIIGYVLQLIWFTCGQS